MGRSNVDLLSSRSKSTEPFFTERADLRETWEDAKGTRVGVVQEACPLAVDDLLVERERGKSHVERISLSLLSVAFLDSVKVYLSQV